MNRLAYFVVLLVAAMLAGCSSHAPSAARFMSAKPNSIYMGFGGGGFWGDDNSHIFLFGLLRAEPLGEGVVEDPTGLQPGGQLCKASIAAMFAWL